MSIAPETPPRRPTIDDVAAHAGVSKTAVSKVLRNSYGLSPLMKARVEASIKELDYRPLVSARLRGQTFTIGVVLPDYENDFFGDIVAGASDHLAATPYQLILAIMEDGRKDGKQAIDALTDRKVDGLLAISPLAETAWLEAVGQRVPFVQLGRHDDSMNYDTIVGDDAAGADRVMDHLLAMGHRSIAHLSKVEEEDGIDHPTTTTAIRSAVYRSRMITAGLADHVSVIDSRFNQGEAYEATSAAIAAGVSPSAIFAGNDQAAFGVARALYEAGMDDVALVGYDDTAMAAHPLVQLTSVAQDGRGMGRLAMDLLFERIKGRREAAHHVMRPELIVRRSSATPLR